jgi:hypothetical protein
MRVAADIVRLSLVGAAAAFVAGGDGAAALKAMTVLAPSVLARLVRVPPALDLAFAVALFAEAVGVFGGGDTVPHLLLPFLSGPVLYVALTRLDLAPRAAGLATFLSVMVVAVAWEVFEWAADAALGTNYSQGYADTRGDLVNDAIAAAASGVVVGVWTR